MKIRPVILALIGTILATHAAFAQMEMAGASPSPAPAMQDQKPPGPPPGAPRPDGPNQEPPREFMRERMMKRFLDKLTEDERVRFENVREKALQDPKIQELRKKADDARDEFMNAVRMKMQQLDPGLDEIVKKNGFDKGGGPRPPRGPEGAGMEKLSPQDRERLDAVRDKVKSDPTVAKARETMQSASTPEDRRAAAEAFRKAMHDAMVKQDPTIEEVLIKLQPPKPPEVGGPEMMQ